MQMTCRACLRRLSSDSRATFRIQPFKKQRRWESSTLARQWSTPLAKGLAEAITTTGPISIASYMRQCLTASDGGYYTSLLAHDRDQFGAKGDFITSPEISQIFGELVGIWVVAEWIAQGRGQEGVHLIELGPGRGTLMDDMLRTICNFHELASGIEAVYLVESSPQLREKQHTLLCNERSLEETEIGWRGTSKHLPNISIFWVEDITLIPQDLSTKPFIIAHEFFDALPIHVFQSVSATQQPDITRSVAEKAGISSTQGLQASAFASASASRPRHEWREFVVTPTLLPDSASSLGEGSHEPPPDFEVSLSKQPTPHSMLLPASSPHYAALGSVAGSTIEISPESLSIVSNIASRIGGGNPVQANASKAHMKRAPRARAPPKSTPSGAALILDYGPSANIPTNSLRGIRSHARVSPFSAPGLVDVSADVDFRALAEAAIGASPGVLVHGPVEQGLWLTAMGIEQRASTLKSGAKTEERRVGIDGSWKRLVDRGPNGMGKLYKAMAILPFKRGEALRRPIGFGGDVNLES